MLLVPTHLAANLKEVFLGDGTTLVDIEQLKNLCIDIVTRKLSDVPFFTFWAGRFAKLRIIAGVA